MHSTLPRSLRHTLHGVEIAQLDPALFVHQYILRLQISVHEALSVQELHALKDLQDLTLSGQDTFTLHSVKSTFPRVIYTFLCEIDVSRKYFCERAVRELPVHMCDTPRPCISVHEPAICTSCEKTRGYLHSFHKDLSCANSWILVRQSVYCIY